MNQRLGYVLATLTVIFSFLTCIAAGLAFYTTRFDKPYLSYPELPFVVLNPFNGVFHAGDTVSYKVTRCNSSGSFKSFRLARMLVHESGQNYLLPEAVVPIAPGCVSSLSVITELPAEIAPGVPLPSGRYHILGASNVDGITQSFDVPWETTWFTVSNSK